MNTESKPMSLLDWLNKSEWEAFKAGKGRLWKAAYARARGEGLGVEASCTKANMVIGVHSTRDTFEPADPATVAQVRIALTDRKIAQLIKENDDVFASAR